MKEGPCGGVPSGAPQTSLVGGQPFTIYFQQNLNHFYLNNPGKLVADFALTDNPAEADFVQLGYVSDYNAVCVIVYTLYVSIYMYVVRLANPAFYCPYSTIYTHYLQF
ncbi:hypothetical protein EON65_49515 [archaeon]|nr:MAG: hypothetical protein EON65_49515 [archaeon]